MNSVGVEIGSGKELELEVGEKVGETLAGPFGSVPGGMLASNVAIGMERSESETL